MAAKLDWQWWKVGLSVCTLPSTPYPSPPPAGKKGKPGVWATYLPNSVFPGSIGSGIGRYDYHPYLPCWLHLHRELGGGKESWGWMQSLGVHGTQGGLQRTESGLEAAWGSPNTALPLTSRCSTLTESENPVCWLACSICFCKDRVPLGWRNPR